MAGTLRHLHWHYIYGKFILDKEHVRYDLDAVYDCTCNLRIARYLFDY